MDRERDSQFKFNAAITTAGTLLFGLFALVQKWDNDAKYQDLANLTPTPIVVNINATPLLPSQL